MRAGWMRPSCEELLERHAGDLAADAVEAGEDDGVRRVVDDEVDAGEVLERADVAALATDDAALHVVARQLDDGDGGLRGVAGGHALHDDGEDVAHAAVGLALGLLLDLADQPRLVVAQLVLEVLEEHRLGLGDPEAGDVLQRADALVAQRLDRVLALAQPRARARPAPCRAARASPRGRSGAPRRGPGRRAVRGCPPPLDDGWLGAGAGLAAAASAAGPSRRTRIVTPPRMAAASTPAPARMTTATP